jgi:hypothetical protein
MFPASADFCEAAGISQACVKSRQIRRHLPPCGHIVLACFAPDE